MPAPEAARRAYRHAIAGAIGHQPGKTINWPALDHALDAAFAAAADTAARLTERALQAEQAALIAAHNERERIRQLESRLRDSHQTIDDMHAGREHDEQRINELARLAADMLSRFDMGHAQTDEEQVARWEATLKGQPA